MKNVLIITAGATPQIVTETVWALAKRAPPFSPSVIHLVTTAQGREIFGRDLLRSSGRLAALFEHLAAPTAETQVHLPTGSDGRELADIRNGEECAAFANTVGRLIARSAADPETRVHISLAGGRKTMSYFAGAAISLFGRDRDELSHVLIEPSHFEQCLDFWYPGQPEDCVHHRGTGESYSPGDARIDIVDIPFLRLSHIMPNGTFADGAPDYHSVLRHAQESLDAQRVRLVPGRRQLVVGPYKVQLAHREFALYRLLAAARLEHWRGAGPDGLGDLHAGWLCYDQLLSANSPVLSRFLDYCDAAYRTGTDEPENFRQFVHSKLSAGLVQEVRKPLMESLAKLSNKIEAQVDNPSIRAKLRVASAGRNPKRIGLTLTPGEIEICESWE